MSRECEGPRLLVFAADDLGRSASVNAAIFDAYDNGILTTAGIMAGGDAFMPAVNALKKRETFSIGLHVTLCDGKAVLPHSAIPDLTDQAGNFSHNAVGVWMKLGRKRVMAQAESEVRAQFDRLDAEGIRPDYVDGHHHLHMHPGLFKLVCRIAAERGVSWIRIPNESLSVAAGFHTRSRGIMPFAEWAVFGLLRNAHLRTARKYGLHCADKVYGLSCTGLMDETRILGLLEHMVSAESPFINEVFFHPDMSNESGLRELAALKSPKVISKLDSLCIKRINYNVKVDATS